MINLYDMNLGQFIVEASLSRSISLPVRGYYNSEIYRTRKTSVWIMSPIHQSGSSLYMRWMKYGNKLRWILIQTANTAARKDDRLRKFYPRILLSTNHSGITHVVNKMITILWYMLVITVQWMVIL